MDLTFCCVAPPNSELPVLVPKPPNPDGAAADVVAVPKTGLAAVAPPNKVEPCGCVVWAPNRLVDAGAAPKPIDKLKVAMTEQKASQVTSRLSITIPASPVTSRPPQQCLHHL